MAIVNFQTHGALEIPAELTFIHPLEARENWTSTGPGFTLGDKFTTLEGPAIFGVEGMSQLFNIWKDKQKFRACVNSVYGKTSKIKEKALSWNQRQANCNENRTKTYDWISSKLTQVDTSYSCACFCICTHSCVDLNLCAMYPFLRQPISSCIVNSYEIKILNHVSNLCVASETNVVSKTFAGHGPL